MPLSIPPRALAVALSLALAASPLAAQTTGLVPLTELGTGTHGGFPGGLYPGGANLPPAAHLDAALARASGIVPRDAGGLPDANGWIGMIAVGMSNTTHEFGAFERNADADPTRNPRVVILDTGFGGQTATTIANPGASYWNTMAQRIAAMGLTPAQIQVAWLKEAESHPPDDFPLHAQALRDTLKRVVQNLHDKFPNLRICYLSSRIYGGYSAPGTLNPEPQAYESGFSVKWVIEDQIAGDPALNHDPLAGDVRAPLLLWGPYLWADGTNPRADGLTWQVTDLEGDHVHPSPAGEQKVAALLAAFFASDTTAKPWWPGTGAERLIALDATDDAHVRSDSPGSNFGADALLLAQGGASPARIYARFDLASIPWSVRLAKLSLRVAQAGGGAVRRVDDTSWNQGTITWSTAPAVGATLVAMPQSSRDGTIGANVTDLARADPDRRISFALETTAVSGTTYRSAEAGHSPRLVLVTSLEPASTPPVTSPARAMLSLASANPFARGVRLRLALSHASTIDLAVFGIDGRRVRSLAGGAFAAGAREIAWDGRDSRGAPSRAGVYFVRLRSGGIDERLKVVLTP